MRMRLLVTGKSGQVATALRERGATEDLEVISVGRPEFDLAHAEAGLAAIRDVEPDVIVSAAAYTAVDRAENEPDEAGAVNAIGPGALARLAADLNVPIIHLSTDYVFDGRKATPYLETDPTNPASMYGRTKLAGEQNVATATLNHVILRTAWVYSPFGNNFLKTMLRLGAERPELCVVDDQRGNPTSALDVADAIIAIANNLAGNPADAGLRGIFHLTGSGEASWADFATEIFTVSGELGGPSAGVVRIMTAEYPTPASRPANSRLSTAKLHAMHGVTMPSWQKSTREVVGRLLSTGRKP